MGRTAAEPRWITLSVIFLTLWGLGHMLAVTILYQLYPGYLELNESSLVVMAKFMLDGEPVYRGLDAADRVTHVHGPLTFLWHALPQAILGQSVASGRLGATIASLLLPAILIATHYRKGWQASALAAAFGAFAILVHLNLSIVVRPDTPIAVVGALAVWAALWGERDGGLKSSLLLGLCCGIAVGFKVNAAVFLLPMALYHVSGDWLRRIPAVGVPALIAAVLPFVHPSFSVHEYLAMMAPMAAKENTWAAFTSLWWKFAIYVAVPPVLWLLAGRHAWSEMGWRLKLYLGVYVLMVLVTLVPATKPGAGHYYLLPFIAPMVDLSLRALVAAGGASRRVKVVLVAVTTLCLAAAWQPERRFFKTLDWDEAAGATAEIHRIMTDFPNKTIQMGLGGTIGTDPLNVRFYAYRSLLVAAGHPYTLDLNTVMELSKLRIPMAEETYRRLETCHTDLWLVPHDEPPFILNGYYYEPAFSRRFQDTFRAHHDRVAQYQYFDVWGCRKP